MCFKKLTWVEPLQWPGLALLNYPTAILSVVLFHLNKSFVLPDVPVLLLTQCCPETSSFFMRPINQSLHDGRFVAIGWCL